MASISYRTSSTSESVGQSNCDVDDTITVQVTKRL